jgi:hypothetical protein
MEKRGFFGLGLNEDTIQFGVLTTALFYENIVEFLGLDSGSDTTLAGLDEGHLKELVEWSFVRDQQGQTRLGESRNLKLLNAVVKSRAALRAFRASKPLLESSYLTEEPKRVFVDELDKSRRSLEHARDQMHLILEDVPPAAIEIISEIEGLAEFLKVSVNAAIAKTDAAPTKPKA